MALRNQPYIPLYVQDFLTDEKLKMCSPSSIGIYINLMCIMHKSEEYGTFLLKQNFKRADKQTKNFASMLVRFLSFSKEEIENALDELIAEKVIILDGDKIIQKRMVSDNKISEVRAISGFKGGHSTQSKNSALAKAKHKAPALTFDKAKVEANTETANEYETEYVNDIESVNGSTTKSIVSQKTKVLKPQQEICEIFSQKYTAMSKQKYKLDTKEFIIIADLIKKVDKEEVIQKIEIFERACKVSAVSEKYIWWFVKDGISAFTIGNFVANYNKIMPFLTDKEKEERRWVELDRIRHEKLEKERQQKAGAL